jgi:hypothetical protein
MRIYLTTILLFLFCFCAVAQKQGERFAQSYALLDAMLNNEAEYSFKDAVFSVENAYLDGKLDKTEFEKEISVYVNLCNSLLKNRLLEYGEKDRETVNKWAAVFTVMTDSIPLYIQDEQYVYTPFSYDFKDVFGHHDKENLFVSKLLKTRKGNCRSLPYLYKILAEELEVNANLALAPNHVYIKHNSERHGWYNTELTSGIFPIDAWIMTSGFVHVDAITNGVYMKALNNKESIAVLLVDLAENYNAKFPDNDGSFALQCAERAIKEYPNFAKALILKAEANKVQWQNETDEKKKKQMLTDLENQLAHIHNLGYRQMPEEMYLNWLVSLKTEREKYENKNLNNFIKN